MPQVKCDCGRLLNYKPEQAGKKVRCPGCKAVLELPAEEVVTLDVVEEEEPASRRKESRPPARAATAATRSEDEDDVPRRRRPRAADEDDEADRPAKRARAVRRPASGPFLARMGERLCSQVGLVAIIVLAAVGIGAGVYGFNEMRLGGRSKPEPTALTLAQLIQTEEKGLDNLHVVVNQFVPDLLSSVSEVSVRKGEQVNDKTVGNRPWKAVYVPLAPIEPVQPFAGGFAPPGMPGPRVAGPIRVILMSRKARNMGELAGLFSGGKVQGMIINSIASLDSKATNLLKESYPGTDFSKVMILEAGRTPSTASFSIAAFAGGVVLVVLAGLLGLTALIFRPR